MARHRGLILENSSLRDDEPAAKNFGKSKKQNQPMFLLKFEFEMVESILATAVGLLFVFGWIQWKNRRKTARLLVETRQKAENLVSSNIRLLANISHEIRTPLHAILGFSQMLSRSPLNDRQTGMLDGIRVSSENLLQLLNDLLDDSRLQAGMLLAEPQPVSLHELIGKVEQLFRAKMQEKKLDFRVEITPDTPDFVQADPLRLTQILTNLVGNAVKFTTQGYVFLLVEMMELEPVCRIRFIVKDTGPGIPKAELGQIFERFKQAKGRQAGGSGLGLAIVKELTELLGGKIGVESHEGFGTTFEVVLSFEKWAQPVEKLSDEADQSVEPPESILPAHHFSGKKVLLVEDNPLSQKFTSMLLSEWGLEITLAATAEQAIQQARLQRFDLILTDILLPDMDGGALAQWLRSTVKIDTPIVAQTGFSQAGERARCLALGMDDYLVKPLDEISLRRTIGRFFKETAAPFEEKTAPHSEKLLHLKYLLDLSKGRHAFVREMLDMFQKQAPLELSDLKTAIKNNDFEQLRATAHGMRSSFAYIGVAEMSLSVLEKMEKLASENASLATLKKQATAIEKLVSQVMKEAAEAEF